MACQEQAALKRISMKTAEAAVQAAYEQFKSSAKYLS